MSSVSFVAAARRRLSPSFRFVFLFSSFAFSLLFSFVRCDFCHAVLAQQRRNEPQTATAVEGLIEVSAHV